jgi:threonine/homoserine/homoserine lactone efflux protein
MDTLLLALGVGLAAGFSPGPLLTLVVTTALERGFAAGARVAMAPLLTDAPIILVSLLVLSELPAGFLAAVTVAGGLLVGYLGVDTLRTARGAGGGLSVEGALEAAPRSGSRDLRRGALVNLLSPHPWIFWMTLGGPELVRSWARSPPLAIGFAAVFFALLVGGKTLIAGLAARSRRLLQGRWYGRVLAVLGAALIALGAMLVAQGIAGWQALPETAPGAVTISYGRLPPTPTAAPPTGRHGQRAGRVRCRPPSPPPAAPG